MARDFQINGECLVVVAGNGALAADSIGTPGTWQLGLSEGMVEISPILHHVKLPADAFGPNVAPENVWMLAEFEIRMTLVHHDLQVLNACVVEAMAGGAFGSLAPAGTTMGRGQPLYAPGNHYVGLALTSPVLNFPWLFPACFLTGQPVKWPLGVKRSAVQMTWKSIPYVQPPQVQPPSVQFPASGSSTLVAVGASGVSVLVAVAMSGGSSELVSSGVNMGGIREFVGNVFTSGLFFYSGNAGNISTSGSFFLSGNPGDF